MKHKHIPGAGTQTIWHTGRQLGLLMKQSNQQRKKSKLASNIKNYDTKSF